MDKNLTNQRAHLPAPVYAAAGAGELAFKKLRTLPERAVHAAGTLRGRVAVRDRDLAAELARMRESAQRGTAVLAARAAAAQERAATGYRNLVARGERVIAARSGVAADPADPARVEVVVGPAQRTARPGATGE